MVASHPPPVGLLFDALAVNKEMYLQLSDFQREVQSSDGSRVCRLECKEYFDSREETKSERVNPHPVYCQAKS